MAEIDGTGWNIIFLICFTLTLLTMNIYITFKYILSQNTIDSGCKEINNTTYCIKPAEYYRDILLNETFIVCNRIACCQKEWFELSVYEGWK